MNLILIGKNFNVEVSMEISDKELLAICNLSNLRMEFANLNKNKAERSEDEKDKKNLSNHTIYLNFRN